MINKPKYNPYESHHNEIRRSVYDCPLKADVHPDILKRKGGACDDDFLEINQRLFESLSGDIK